LIVPWSLSFHPDAAKELKKLDRATASRIVETLATRVGAKHDPRALGAPLKGDHAGYWRWRIGDYRVIAHIDDSALTILVIRVAHRRQVYR
jgi:mRNA interferase RelE/StbE